MTRTLAPAAPAWLVLSCLLLASSPAYAQALQPPPPLAPGATGAPRPASLPSTPLMPPSRSKDEAEDSGLGLEWVWINADIGAAFVNMQSFSESNLGLTNTQSGGPALGFGAGVRLIFLHTRIWRIDPYFGVRGGYNFVGSLNSDSVQVASGGSPSDVSVHGFNVGPMVGIDVYLAKIVSIGADVDTQFFFLQRPPPPLPPGIQVSQLPAQQRTLYQNSGSSAGFGVTGTAHLGIHF
jgi:hypothetical protein